MKAGQGDTSHSPPRVGCNGRVNRCRRWTSIDTQDTLAFSARTGVRSMNETFPLERVAEAYDRMMSGKARFRVVLDVSSKS